MLSDLKSIAVQATPIALDVYDKTDPTTLLPLVAVVVSDPSLAEEVNLEWAAWYAARPDYMERFAAEVMPALRDYEPF